MDNRLKCLDWEVLQDMEVGVQVHYPLQCWYVTLPSHRSLAMLNTACAGRIFHYLVVLSHLMKHSWLNERDYAQWMIILNLRCSSPLASSGAIVIMISSHSAKLIYSPCVSFIPQHDLDKLSNLCPPKLSTHVSNYPGWSPIGWQMQLWLPRQTFVTRWATTDWDLVLQILTYI